MGIVQPQIVEGRAQIGEEAPRMRAVQVADGGGEQCDVVERILAAEDEPHFPRMRMRETGLRARGRLAPAQCAGNVGFRASGGSDIGGSLRTAVAVGEPLPHEMESFEAMRGPCVPPLRCRSKTTGSFTYGQ